MKFALWGIAILCVLYVSSALAQFDEPADTLRSDSLVDWPDTSLVLSDTFAVSEHTPLRRGWLYPLGIAAVTCVGFLMLFTVRSR